MTDKDESTVEQRQEAIRAIVRVLELLDGYLSTENPHALLSWRGGMMTRAELRAHASGARELAVKEFGKEIAGLSHESTRTRPTDTNLSQHDLEDVGAAIAGDATNFTTMLLRMIAKSDPVNRERLRLAYPEAVEAWEKWQRSPPQKGPGT
jgi:hypothetical protein